MQTCKWLSMISLVARVEYGGPVWNRLRASARPDISVPGLCTGMIFMLYRAPISQASLAHLSMKGSLPLAEAKVAMVTIESQYRVVVLLASEAPHSLRLTTQLTA